MSSKTANAPDRYRIGHHHVGEQPHDLGIVALRDGQIEIEQSGSQDDREKLARMLAGMFHSRYADETALFASLPHRLNNGYLYCHPVSQDEQPSPPAGHKPARKSNTSAARKPNAKPGKKD